MMWALQRQLFFILILVAFFLVVGFLVGYPRLNKPPTCSDGKQNGMETGVDCGGACQIACVAEQEEISILWARTFRVVPGRYNAVAYLENKNEGVVVNKIKYRFRFADKDNIFIGMREGEAFVPPSGKFAVFEPAIGVGNSIPIYTTFEFLETPAWVQVPQDFLDQLKVFVSNINLEDELTSPRMSATIRNFSLLKISEINIVAILYDAMGNAVSASRTYLDTLPGEESIGINFTWPEPLSGEVVATEIIPMYNVFLIKLR